MTTYEGVKPGELEKLKFAFSIFETNPNKLDSQMLGDLMRALNVNPSLDRLKTLGVGKKRGEKFFNVDECCKMYSELKNDVKNMGSYEDLIACLKVYDKAENGKLLLSEFQQSLLCLGEKLSDDQVEDLFEDCMGEEDEEGEVEYIPFLRAMCEMKKAEV